MALDPIPNQQPEENLEENLERDLISESSEEPKEEEREQRVPYHQDPNVQLYIERQIAKRLGEGNQAWEERINKLENRLTSRSEDPSQVNIGGWTPGSPQEALAAKAIISQAKREMLEEFEEAEREQTAAQVQDDRAFADWLGELRVTGTLNNDEDEKEFARLIVEYNLDDPQAAIKLWNRLNTAKSEAIEEGEKNGIKKAQEAKVGSSRRTSEPGTRARSYNERRNQEPNFDAILEREMNRLGY